MDLDHNSKYVNTPKANSSSIGASKERLNTDKASRKVSFKAQKQSYQLEKQKAAQEFLNVLDDPTVIILSDWLKIRGSLKGWTKMYCVLKPGLLMLYSSEKVDKHGRWIGTIILPSCRIIERPSKKNGFCFKIFNPMSESIWTSKGPKGETIGAVTQPLPYSHLIFRAPSEEAGKCWMDAISLATKCSSLLLRSMTNNSNPHKLSSTSFNSKLSLTTELGSKSPHDDPCSGDYLIEPRRTSHLSEPGTFVTTPSHDNTAKSAGRSEPSSPSASHNPKRFFASAARADDFEGIDDDEDEEAGPATDDDSSQDDSRDVTRDVTAGSVAAIGTPVSENIDDATTECPESRYVEEESEDLGTPGEAGQMEEVGEENKSLIWALVKQVKPGMDLSKVTLPTFILEPRSFLDKLTDYYYHSDILAQAQTVDDPLTRMKIVTKWYLSGFYKKPRGLKKPYNSVLGEVFRCLWCHPQTSSRTFYMAEQISHHPPISAFYVTNRKDGYAISGTILTRSKFYGNSISAILEGSGRLTFLPRGEDYLVTMPYAHCKGILVGTLTMELGGKVSIECAKTGYSTLLEFKLKPMFGSADSANLLTGRIKLGEETLAKLDGHWDGQIHIKDVKTGKTELFWDAQASQTLESRLKRSVIPLDEQRDNESEKLWLGLSEALLAGDQERATAEKTAVEDRQREKLRELKALNEEWNPVLFSYHTSNGEWLYKYCDLRPWDPLNDLHQFELNFVIQTKTLHKTPISFPSSLQYENLDTQAASKRLSLHHNAPISHDEAKVSSSVDSSPAGTLDSHRAAKSRAATTQFEGEESADKFRHLFESMQAIQAENAKILKNLNDRLMGNNRNSDSDTSTTDPKLTLSATNTLQQRSKLTSNETKEHHPKSKSTKVWRSFGKGVSGMKELLLITFIFVLSQIFVTWMLK